MTAERKEAWFAGIKGDGLTVGELWPIVKQVKFIQDSGAFTHIRCWCRSDDVEALRFANWLGLHYDCGPATGLLPSGRDATLMLWRK